MKEPIINMRYYRVHLSGGVQVSCKSERAARRRAFRMAVEKPWDIEWQLSHVAGGRDGNHLVTWSDAIEDVTMNCGIETRILQYVAEAGETDLAIDLSLDVAAPNRFSAVERAYLLLRCDIQWEHDICYTVGAGLGVDVPSPVDRCDRIRAALGWHLKSADPAKGLWG